MSPTSLHDLIRKRRSIYPQSYTDQPISMETLSEIIESANWAPTHRKTEPWRLIIIQGEDRAALANYLGKYYLEHTPEENLSEIKLKKIRQKPLQSQVVLAICMQRDPEERLPEWEEIAATAMAVQNMWLSCTAHGIGSYWSSPGSVVRAEAARQFLHLREGERCLGLFYMGHHHLPDLPGTRQPINEKIRKLGQP